MYLLDHLVHFVEKPEHLVEKTSELGLHTASGGKHDMWGTYNSLCYFGLAYIEFIGIFDKALFDKSAQEPYTLHETYKNKNLQNGVVRIALRTDTIEKDAENLRSLGYSVYGPTEFSRTRPNGSILKWKLLHFGKENQNIEFPFIIQWNGSDENRYNDLVASGTIKQHPLGPLQIKEIEIEVEHLATAAEWGSVFNFEVEDNGTDLKMKMPNTFITFTPSTGSNNISKIILSGAKKEKEVFIEGTKYLFQK
ncbi:VOC family protein [Lysinibacillus fusiformis]|nr:VOC family protein [Lysinibacillus fusiformis]